MGAQSNSAGDVHGPVCVAPRHKEIERLQTMTNHLISISAYMPVVYANQIPNKAIAVIANHCLEL